MKKITHIVIALLFTLSSMYAQELKPILDCEISGTASDYYKMAVNKNEHIFIAYNSQQDGKIHVTKFNGTTWTEISDTNLSEATNSDKIHKFFINPENSLPVIVIKKDDVFFVKKFNGTKWIDLENFDKQKIGSEYTTQFLASNEGNVNALHYIKYNAIVTTEVHKNDAWVYEDSFFVGSRVQTYFKYANKFYYSNINTSRDNYLHVYELNKDTKTWKNTLLDTKVFAKGNSIIKESNNATNNLLYVTKYNNRNHIWGIFNTDKLINIDKEGRKEIDFSSNYFRTKFLHNENDRYLYHTNRKKLREYDFKFDTWRVIEENFDLYENIQLSKQGNIYCTKKEGSVIKVFTNKNFKTPIYVDVAATGNNNGTSWENAYNSLTDALDSASPHATIWVAKGTYTPTTKDSDPRKATFTIRKNLNIYGGFSGNETKLEQRNLKENITILSGDLQGNDANEFTYESADRQDNAYNVITFRGNPSANKNGETIGIIDGFTITGGNANGTEHRECSSNYTNSNEEFEAQYNNSSGGAIIAIPYWKYKKSDEDSENFYERRINYNFTNCILEKNSSKDSAVMATLFPCGMNESSSYYVYGTTFYVNLQFDKCVIRNNSGNSTAFYYYSDGTPYYSGSVAKTSIGFSNSLLYDNKSKNSNAISGTNATYKNCTITKNSGKNGFVLTGYEKIYNTIVYGNGTFSPLEESDGTQIKNSIINGETNPKFKDPDNYDFTLLEGSPAIDTGSNDYVYGSVDFNNQTRISNQTVDMGAFEVQVATPEPTDFFGGKKYIFAKADATGNNDGSNWENAYTNIEEAAEAAALSEEKTLLIAKGTYVGQIKVASTNFRIYGGFNGTETSFEQRDIVGLASKNETIISGDKNGNDDGSVASLEDNIGTVIYLYNNRESLIVDGITVTGARNKAFYIENVVHTTIKNTRVYKNYGNYIDVSDRYRSVKSFLVDNCIFENNVAEESASGIYLGISANQAESYGGYELSIKNSIFMNNDTKGRSLVYMLQKSSSNNYRAANELNFYDNTVAKNKCKNPITCYTANALGKMKAYIRRNVFYNNTLKTASTPIIDYNSSYWDGGLTVTESLIYGNNSDKLYEVDDPDSPYDPQVNTFDILTEDPLYTEGDTFTPSEKSPLLNKGIVKSENAPDYDVYGNKRYYNYKTDIGAIEYNGKTDGTANIEEITTNEGILIYPNPTTGVINFRLLDTNTSIKGLQIYDFTGRVVFASNKIVDNFNFSSLPSGMYLVKIVSNKGVKTKKIIFSRN